MRVYSNYLNAHPSDAFWRLALKLKTLVARPIEPLLDNIHSRKRERMKTEAEPNQFIPKSTMQWTVVGEDGLNSLRYSEEPIPELGDNQVLVKSRCLASAILPQPVKEGYRLTTTSPQSRELHLMYDPILSASLPLACIL